MPEGLQLILGADDKNEFTIYKDTNMRNFIYSIKMGQMDLHRSQMFYFYEQYLHCYL